jgi:hypothetical protein
MRVGLTYDLRADYEALGLAGEEIAEFDTPRRWTRSRARCSARAATPPSTGSATSGG